MLKFLIEQTAHILFADLKPIHEQRAINITEIVLHRHPLIYFNGGPYLRVITQNLRIDTRTKQQQRCCGTVVGAFAVIRAYAASKL